MKRAVRRILPLAFAILIGVGLAATCAAAAPVSGTVVGAAKYTLLVMGRTRVVEAVKLNRSGHFSVNAPPDVTLQLLRPNNTFFGPVVVARSDKRVYEALAGHRLVLGKIRLRAGYATTSKQLGMSAVDRHVWARADRSGKPAGAGNLGLLVHHGGHGARVAESGGPSSGSSQPLPPGGDPTHVGIVTAFNADVTGAGVPNAESPASAQASGDGLFTEIFQPLQMSVNTDAVGVTPAQVSELVRSDLRMDFYLDAHAAGGAPVTGVTVDCGALVYCASGTGTGTVSNAGINNGAAVGARWDGSAPPSSNGPGIFAVQIAPNVGTDQIHPGDVFLVHYHTPTGDVVQPTTLTLYFLTVPALASYDSGAGTQAVSYPAAQNAPGTQSNPIMLASGRVTMSIWRPQRAALPGEAGSFFDIGHLHYGTPVTVQGGSREAGCGAQFYSGLSPTLQVSQGAQDDVYNQLFPLHDTAGDAPASAANQISFTLDLAGCLAADGIATATPIVLPITAVDESRRGGTDRAVQSVIVCLPGCNPSVGAGP
jgi:hypothetical protein